MQPAYLYVADTDSGIFRWRGPTARGSKSTPGEFTTQWGLQSTGGTQFPVESRGDIFVAEHGSWNKAVLTGYEVIRVLLEKGHAAGEYQDFLTGFVTPSLDVWGRPVGVSVAKGGSLIVTDGGSNTVWRVAYSLRHDGPATSHIVHVRAVEVHGRAET